MRPAAKKPTAKPPVTAKPKAPAKKTVFKPAAKKPPKVKPAVKPKPAAERSLTVASAQFMGGLGKPATAQLAAKKPVPKPAPKKPPAKPASPVKPTRQHVRRGHFKMVKGADGVPRTVWVPTVVVKG